MNKQLFSQRNWIKKNESPSKPPTAVLEYDIYSDARFTGQVNRPAWPYAFLNAFSFEPGTVDTKMVLRIEDYEYYVNPSDVSSADLSKTHDDSYHGGWYDDEIVSLASLILGVRLASGGVSRRWDQRIDNPYGQPERLGMKPKLPFDIRDGGILPHVTGEHSMMNLENFDLILHIESHRFVSLVRASSAYRNALWLVELDANLAWLLFVSALETAVRDVYSSRRGMNSRQFRDFVIRFRPDPPTQRPSADGLQFEWTEDNFEKMTDIVYQYRSRMLHKGTPFPAPMLSRPWQYDHNSPPIEVPGPGLAMSTMGGTWRKEDIPINLHVFHYITRHSLLNWWERELTNSAGTRRLLSEGEDA